MSALLRIVIALARQGVPGRREMNIGRTRGLAMGLLGQLQHLGRPFPVFFPRFFVLAFHCLFARLCPDTTAQHGICFSGFKAVSCAFRRLCDADVAGLGQGPGVLELVKAKLRIAVMCPETIAQWPVAGGAG